MEQSVLFQDNTIQKKLIKVHINELTISQFNPRITRSDEDIDKLAQRIARNGFEITRALWAYRNCNSYEIFAGGNRLEAARRAGCKTIPIILHEGLTEEDIVRLADEDNENDEYHAKVSPVDVWQHYAWLKERGWDVPQIAKAKNVNDRIVYYRLKLHGLPDKIKTFCTQGLLDETHLREILAIELEFKFMDWLTTVQAWEELASKAIYDKGKNGSKSVRAVKDDIDQWREFITYAEQVYNSLSPDVPLYDLSTTPPTPYNFNVRQAFVSELGKLKARSLAKVKAAEQAVKSLISANLRQYQHYIEQQSTQAAQEAMRVELEAQLLAKFVLGNCLEVLDNWTLGKIQLLLIDPPYGKEYQSNRRWMTKPPDKIKGDNGQEAIELLQQAIDKVIPLLVDNAHTLIFCDWKKEPEVRQIIEQAGLTIKGSLVWVKEEHSAGDVKGAFGPSHERIIHAVKGSPEVTPRIRDVLEVARSRETSHPTEKPIKLLEPLISSTTNEGDLVVDLFAGCASTLVAAFHLNRDFFGVEIDQNYHEEGSNRLLRELAKNG